MKCPSCGVLDTRVVDSRLSREGDMVRRRRECADCKRRFTTYERLEESLPLIVKKDGGRQAFSRDKIMAGIEKACHKRPVSAEHREEIVEKAVRAAMDTGEKEVPGAIVGEVVMRELRRLDAVAYVRYASVYRRFSDLEEFADELKNLESNGV